MADTYSVVLTGKLAEGRSPEQVKANVGKLFRLSEAKLDKLLCGKPMSVRKGISREQAEKICKALTKAGAIAGVRAERPLAQAETGIAKASVSSAEAQASGAAVRRESPANKEALSAREKPTAPQKSSAGEKATAVPGQAPAAAKPSAKAPSTPDLECPRCGHTQAFARACEQCKMDLTLHIQRLERREKARARRRKVTG